MPGTTDKNGRPWAKLSELKVGSLIECDDGFTCICSDLIRVVGQHNGRLYFACADGLHYLDGQADDGEHLIGIYKV